MNRIRITCSSGGPSSRSSSVCLFYSSCIYLVIWPLDLTSLHLFSARTSPSRLRDSQLEQLYYQSLLRHSSLYLQFVPYQRPAPTTSQLISPLLRTRDRFPGLTSAPRSHPSFSNNFSKPKIAFHVDEGDLSPTPMDSVTSHHSLRASSCPSLWRTVEDILHVDVNVSSGNVLYNCTEC